MRAGACRGFKAIVILRRIVLANAVRPPPRPPAGHTPSRCGTIGPCPAPVPSHPRCCLQACLRAARVMVERTQAAPRPAWTWIQARWNGAAACPAWTARPSTPAWCWNAGMARSATSWSRCMSPSTAACASRKPANGGSTARCSASSRIPAACASTAWPTAAGCSRATWADAPSRVAKATSCSPSATGPDRGLHMKRCHPLLLACLLLLAPTAVLGQDTARDPGTGDAVVDARLADIDRYAARYPEAFVDELVRYFDAPGALIEDQLGKDRAPGDLYYACALARVSGRPCRGVLEAWIAGHEEGWQGTARDVGVVPGDARALRLREGIAESYARWGRPLPEGD